ncbi:hypothetical protein GLYMA_07G254200v4 [Glycine max]|nr:hypothetical protein GLYMA_07G254200v4 [Glycine max]KAH1088584.1 hypothetical protein GYH30_019562 [Glycine max]
MLAMLVCCRSVVFAFCRVQEFDSGMVYDIWTVNEILEFVCYKFLSFSVLLT